LKMRRIVMVSLPNFKNDFPSSAINGVLEQWQRCVQEQLHCMEITSE
jgi:hypothetical protein